MSPDRLLEGLNPAQREAVEATAGTVCILAGAGSGKTTTITRRLAYQVATDAFPAHSLLAVTFTDKAAGEMRTRLARAGADGIAARTFHSAALKQLRYFRPDEVGSILASKGTIVAPYVRQLPKPHRFIPVADVAGEIEWAKNQRIGPDIYLTSLGTHQPPIPQDHMHRIYARYEDEKTRRGMLDFEDMLERAIRMFEEDDHVAAAFWSRYQAFTVDEFQDVNLLQATLLERWLGGRDDLCVVGDDYQAIYSFTGASPEHLLRLPRRDRVRVFKLETNYRSTPEILAAANRLVPNLRGASKELKADRASGSDPVLRGFEGSGAESAFIAGAISELNQQGIAYDDMAILYRINARAEDYEETLAARSIPYRLWDDSFLQRPAARQILPRLKRVGTSIDVAAKVSAAAEALGFSEELSGDVGRAEYARQKDLARFVRLGEGFEDGARTVADFIEDTGRRFARESGSGGVNLLTLHRAKGLEFEAVFIPKAEDNELPHKRADIDEERRLFYVGLTRAKRFLYVTWSVRKPASPFVAELGGAPAAKKRRLAPPPKKKQRGIEATIGTRVAVTGGHTGTISDIHDDRVIVDLGQGATLVVKYGETVKADDRSGPLIEPPDDDERLRRALKEWRLRRAQADGVSAFVVMHDSTLNEIVETFPRNMVELGRVEGIGPRKLELYGTEILAQLSGAPAQSVKGQ
jgi:DNA helicase-2/ATP-dependent DNA helicase PcrA